MAGVVISGDVQVRVAQAVQAMNELGKSFGDLQKTINGSLGQAPQTVNKASESIGGFTEKLREFKGEQVQQGRMGKFLVGEFLDIIPAAEGAKGAISGVMGVAIEAFSGGLGIGVVLEGAKLIGSAWKYFEEQEKVAQEQADKLSKALSDQTAEIWRNVDALERRARGMSEPEQKRQALLNNPNKDLGGRSILEEERAILREREEYERKFRSMPVWRQGGNLDEYERRQMDFAVRQTQVDQARAAINAQFRNEESQARTKMEDDLYRQRIEFENKVRTSRVQNLDEVAKLEVEKTNEIQSLIAKIYDAKGNLREGMTPERAAAEQAAIELDIQIKINKVLSERRIYWAERAALLEVNESAGMDLSKPASSHAQWTMEDQKRQNTNMPGFHEVPVFGPGNDEGEGMFKWVQDAGKRTAEAWNAVGDAFTSAGQGFVALGAAVNSQVGVFLGGMMQIITAAIKMAVAFASIESAKTPFIGWAAAIAGAVAMAATLVAVIGGIQARASGGPVGPGTYLVGERGPELLALGAGQSGQVIPNHALGGSTFNISFSGVTDRDWWRANEGHVVEVLSRAVRNGRWG